MRSVLSMALLAAALCPAQQLKVKSATARSVQLTWDGSGKEWIIERKGSGPFQKIATSPTPGFEDTKIDPYGTYTYRISASPGAKPSNEVIVGPPPMGVLPAAPAPASGEPGNYGPNSALTRDENGDPAFAFIWLDPNADGNLTDTSIQFVRWNRAAHSWAKPVSVATTGDLPSKNVEPISIACDPATGALAIALSIHEAGVNVALSSDHGATWKVASVLRTEAPVSSTAVALASGTIYFAANSSNGIRYFTGPIADEPSKWKSESAPKSAGWSQPDSTNIALTLDSAGKPILAWYEIKEEGESRRFQVWRPGSSPITALQTTLGTDFPNLALTSGAGKLGLLTSNPLNEKNGDLSIWYASSSDGNAWTKPVMLPVDGPRSTNAPLSVAFDSHGRLIAAFGSNSGSEGPKCGAPMVSRSSDGTQWKTCGFGDFDAQPNTLHVITSGDDTAYVVWQQASDSKAGKGVLIWHGR